MNLQKALDVLEQMPECFSACLLTAKGEVLTGNRSAINKDSASAMLIRVLKINTIFKNNNEKSGLHGVTIIDNQKKIITRFTGKPTERVLLALELANDAKEKKIKLKVYSLFETE
jgi:hypothetical protein